MLGYFSSLEAPVFLELSIWENFARLVTDNACGQLSEHTFSPNGGYYLYMAV